MIKWLSPRADYLTVWQAMRDFTEQRNTHTHDEIWLCEHAPVYTLGQAGRPEHILNPRGIPVVHCDRGGQVTYHGPGQVLLYSLLDLRRANLYVRDYVLILEETALQVLAGFGIVGVRKPGAPGVYVARGAGELAKIAALGVKIRNGRAYHGLALNVAMDLGPFQGINPCGYEGLTATDMATHGVCVDLRTVGDALAQQLRQCLAHAIDARRLPRG